MRMNKSKRILQIGEVKDKLLFGDSLIFFIDGSFRLDFHSPLPDDTVGKMEGLIFIVSKDSPIAIINEPCEMFEKAKKYHPASPTRFFNGLDLEIKDMASSSPTAEYLTFLDSMCLFENSNYDSTIIITDHMNILHLMNRVIKNPENPYLEKCKYPEIIKFISACHFRLIEKHKQLSVMHVNSHMSNADIGLVGIKFPDISRMKMPIFINSINASWKNLYKKDLNIDTYSNICHYINNDEDCKLINHIGLIGNKIVDAMGTKE